MQQITFDELVNSNVCEIRLIDKVSQKREMEKLDSTIKNKNSRMYIKANTIANKAVSIKFGYPKTIKKEQMSIEMLKEREKILEQVTSLMIAQSLGVDIPHIAEVIYKNIDL